MDFRKTLFYYEKLGFENVDSWSEKDLSSFLIWDFIEITSPIYPNSKNLVEKRISQASKKHNKHIFLKFLFSLYNKTLSRKFSLLQKKTPKVLFNIYAMDKYLPIISAAKKDYQVNMLVWGIKDRIFAAKNKILAEYFPNVGYFIDRYMAEGNAEYLQKVVNVVTMELKRINPDFIVLGGDALPVERSIVLSAKVLGIPTLEIQHGAYVSSIPLETGRAADYVLVWGDYYKNLYVRQNVRRAEDIFVLGYPFQLEKIKENKKKGRNISLCYLGENYEVYNNSLLDYEIKHIKSIADICKNNKIDFFYRPHPKQDMGAFSKLISGIKFTNHGEKLSESFLKYDAFVSLSSTSLIEASMSGKLSLQLMDFPIKLDNFENLGACSKSFNNIEELNDYLCKMAESNSLSQFKKDFNNKYIETKTNAQKRFLEILNIIKK